MRDQLLRLSLAFFSLLLVLISRSDAANPSTNPVSIQALIQKLESHDQDQRQQAVRAINGDKVLQEQVINALASQVKKTRGMERQNAERALGRLGLIAQRALPVLIDAARDHDTEAIDAMGDIAADPQDCMPLLLRALNSPRSEDVCSAAAAIGKFGPAAHDAVPALTKLLTSSDDDVPSAAAAALGKIGPAAAPALPQLRQRAAKVGLHSEDAQYLAQAFGGIGKPALPDLMKLIDSYDAGTSILAYDAIARMKGDAAEAIPTLIKRLKSDDPKSQYIIETFGKIGAAAKPAVPELIKIYNDGYYGESHYAAHALNAIDPTAAREAGIPDCKPPYLAWVQEQEEVFNRRSLTVSTIGAPVGCMVEWVNGDPVGFFTQGGAMEQLDEWLVPGRNELTFSQPHSPSVFVLVSSSVAYEEPKLLGAQAFAGLGGTEPAPALVFNVDQLDPQIERQPLAGIPEAQLQTEVQKILSHLADLINKHEGRQARELLLAGQLASTDPREVKNLQRGISSYSKIYNDPKVTASISTQPIQVIVGKRALLAYVQMPSIGKNAPNLISIRKDHASFGLPWLIFARINGHLVIWHPSSGLGFSLKSGN